MNSEYIYPLTYITGPSFNAPDGYILQHTLDTPVWSDFNTKGILSGCLLSYETFCDNYIEQSFNCYSLKAISSIYHDYIRLAMGNNISIFNGYRFVGFEDLSTGLIIDGSTIYDKVYHLRAVYTPIALDFVGAKCLYTLTGSFSAPTFDISENDIGYDTAVLDIDSEKMNLINSVPGEYVIPIRVSTDNANISYYNRGDSVGLSYRDYITVISLGNLFNVTFMVGDTVYAEGCFDVTDLFN